MRTHSAEPRTSDEMNLFGLFFALLASIMVAVLLIVLFVIGR